MLVSFFLTLRSRTALPSTKAVNRPDAAASESPASTTHDDVAAVEATETVGQLDFSALAGIMPRLRTQRLTTKAWACQAWACLMERSLRLLPSIDEIAALVVNAEIEARLLRRRARRFEPLHLDCFDDDDEDDDDANNGDRVEQAQAARKNSAAIVIQRFLVAQQEKNKAKLAAAQNSAAIVIVRFIATHNEKRRATTRAAAASAIQRFVATQHEKYKTKYAALAAIARATEETLAAIAIQRFFRSKRASISAVSVDGDDHDSNEATENSSESSINWSSSSTSTSASRPQSTIAASHQQVHLQAHARAYQKRLASVKSKVNSFNVPAPRPPLSHLKLKSEVRLRGLEPANRGVGRRAKVNSFNHVPTQQPQQTSFQLGWRHFQAELRKRNSIARQRLQTATAKVSTTRPHDETVPRARAAAVPRSTPSLNDPAIAAANAKLRLRIRSAVPATNSHSGAASARVDARAIKRPTVVRCTPEEAVLAQIHGSVTR